jgi:hypothetical protein
MLELCRGALDLDAAHQPARHPEPRRDRVLRQSRLRQLRHVQRPAEVPGQERNDAQRRLPAAQQRPQRAMRARPIAARDSIRQLFHRGGASDDRDGLDVLPVDERARPRIERRLVDFRRQPREVEARAIHQQRRGGGTDLVPQLAGEPDDPILKDARVGDAREGERPAVALERRQELAARVQSPRHEHQTCRRTQARHRA